MTDNPQMPLAPPDGRAAALAAFVAAQAEFAAIRKNRENPHFKARYADLAAVLDATMPALNKHGLLALQPITCSDGAAVLWTHILHRNGTTVAEASVPIDMNGGEQKAGSRLTYMRRYLLTSLLCVAAEDDDGAAANAGSTSRASMPDDEYDRHIAAIKNAPDYQSLKAAVYAASEAAIKAGDQASDAEFRNQGTARKKELQAAREAVA